MLLLYIVLYDYNPADRHSGLIGVYHATTEGLDSAKSAGRRAFDKAVEHGHDAGETCVFLYRVETGKIIGGYASNTFGS